MVRTHTPLHLAARNGHMNVVSYFLSCGMDVNITVSMFARDSNLYVSIVKRPISVRFRWPLTGGGRRREVIPQGVEILSF